MTDFVNFKKIAQISFVLFFFIMIININLSAEEKFKNPILEKYLYKLRDPKTNRKNFRKILQCIGEFLSLEISETLEKKEVTVNTLTNAEAVHRIIKEDPILITVARAGFPFHKGFLNVFSNAKSGFFAASRNENTAKSDIFYKAIPQINNKVVILVDPMIATGGTIDKCINILNTYGPKKIIVAGVFVSKYAEEFLLNKYPDIQIFAAIIDPCLNDKWYIIPGCGDAGDRCYGEKNQ